MSSKSMVSGQWGLTTHDQAVNAEADRLLKLDTALTPRAAMKQAAKNVASGFYQQPDGSKDIEEKRRQKKFAEQQEFEEAFLKTMRK